MVNKNYRRGYSFERTVRIFLEERGGYVSRNGGSKFPDLTAIFSWGTLFVECKNWKKIPNDPIKLLSSEEYSAALELVKKYTIPFLLFYNVKGKIKALPIGGYGLRQLSMLGLLVNETKREIFKHKEA